MTRTYYLAGTAPDDLQTFNNPDYPQRINLTIYATVETTGPVHMDQLDAPKEAYHLASQGAPTDACNDLPTIYDEVPPVDHRDRFNRAREILARYRIPTCTSALAHHTDDRDRPHECICGNTYQTYGWATRHANSCPMARNLALAAGSVLIDGTTWTYQGSRTYNEAKEAGRMITMVGDEPTPSGGA